MARREVLVQLDDELVRALDTIAKRLRISRSELIRRAAAALINKDLEIEADRRMVESYRRVPQDPAFIEAAARLAAETVLPYDA